MKLEISKEEMEVLKELFMTMKQKGMNQEIYDYRDVFLHVAGMQKQMAEMAKELEVLRAGFSKVVNPEIKHSTSSISKEILPKLQKKVVGFSNQLNDVKKSMIKTASKAVASFKKKGQMGMLQVLEKETNIIKEKFEQSRQSGREVLEGYISAQERINQVRNELNMAETSIKNAGKLMQGDEEKSMDNLRKLFKLNPMMKDIKQMEKNVASFEKTYIKLDRMSSLIGKNMNKEFKKLEKLDKKMNHKIRKLDRLSQLVKGERAIVKDATSQEGQMVASLKSGVQETKDATSQEGQMVASLKSSIQDTKDATLQEVQKETYYLPDKENGIGIDDNSSGILEQLEKNKEILENEKREQPSRAIELPGDILL